jgi:hypothetical protein
MSKSSHYAWCKRVPNQLHKPTDVKHNFACLVADWLNNPALSQPGYLVRKVMMQAIL